MRILAMTNTYYMLLVAIQLRTTIYKHDIVDLIFTDACANSEEIYNKIVESEIFNKTEYIKIDTLADNGKNKISKLSSLFLRLKKPKSVLKTKNIDLSNTKYDVFLSYVAGRVEEQIVFNQLKSVNSECVVNLFEESYVSYYSPYGIMSIENKRGGLNQVKLMPIIMSIIGKKNELIINNIKKAWYFEPSLVQYSSNYEICAIPKMDNIASDVLKKINRIFDYEKWEKTFEVDTIFLEDSWHLRNSEYGDLQLIELISNTVRDKNEFMVKLHPRSKDNRFERLGVKTNQSSVPLEVIVMNSKNNNNRYLSIGSGAPLVCLANFSMPNTVIMLYKCCKGLVDAITDEKFSKYVQDLKERYTNRLLIPENIDDLKQLLLEFGRE